MLEKSNDISRLGGGGVCGVTIPTIAQQDLSLVGEYRIQGSGFRLDDKSAVTVIIISTMNSGSA